MAPVEIPAQFGVADGGQLNDDLQGGTDEQPITALEMEFGRIMTITTIAPLNKAGRNAGIVNCLRAYSTPVIMLAMPGVNIAVQPGRSSSIVIMVNCGSSKLFAPANRAIGTANSSTSNNDTSQYNDHHTQEGTDNRPQLFAPFRGAYSLNTGTSDELTMPPTINSYSWLGINAAVS